MAVFAPWFAYAQTRITGDNVTFFYYAWTESSEDKISPLVRQISRDYRLAQDEFARKRAFSTAKPIVESRLHDARQSSRIHLVVGRKRLMDYDFNRKAFPIHSCSDFLFLETQAGIAACSTSPAARVDLETDLPGISLSYRKDREARIGYIPVFYIPVDLEDAESLAPHLRDSRNVTWHVDGYIERAGSRRRSRYATSASQKIYVRVQKIEVRLTSGIEVGTIDFGNTPPARSSDD